MDIFQIIDKIKKFLFGIKDFLFELPYPEIISVLKTICVVTSFLLFAGIIFVIFGLNIFYKIKRRLGLFALPKQFPKKKLIKRWERIEKKLKLGNGTELKLAVIEADNFFDNILKRIGYSGKDMGGRLKKINSSQMANINDIWSAHKIRNNIVHDIDYKLIPLDAELAVGAYRKALEELEVL